MAEGALIAMERLFPAAAVFYFLAALGHFLWAKDVLKNARIGKAFLVLGFVLHSAEILRLGALTGMFPLYNLRNALLFFSWCVVLLYGALLIRYRFEMLSFFTVVLALVFILPATVIPNPAPLGDRPALHDWVTALHIGLSIFSYAAFCVASLAACGYLVEHRRLKNRDTHAVVLRLPPLEMLDTIQTKSIRCGLSTLGLGILTGFCWAVREAWTVLAEPKILMTGFVFAVYLALALIRGRFRSSTRSYSAAVVGGFILCLASFFLINLLAHGKHQF